MAYSVAIVHEHEQAANTDTRYFLLDLDAEHGQLSITGYPGRHLDIAEANYMAAESRNAGKPGCDAVLVSASSLKGLRRAYPNYFADTGAFVKALDRAVE